MNNGQKVYQGSPAIDSLPLIVTLHSFKLLNGGVYLGLEGSMKKLQMDNKKKNDHFWLGDGEIGKK